MASIVSISDIEVVVDNPKTSPADGRNFGDSQTQRSFDPEEGDSEGDRIVPGDEYDDSGEESESPGKKFLDEDGKIGGQERLSNDFLDRIRETIGDSDKGDGGPGEEGEEPAEWWGRNPGNIEVADSDGEESTIGVGVGNGDNIKEYEFPGDYEREEYIIDKALKDFLEKENIDRIEKAKEQEGKYSRKGKGIGVGGFIDRIEAERKSQINWAQIFKKRLTDYSKSVDGVEKPWNRRFIGSGNPIVRRITSKTPSMDTISGLNVLIDTSGSVGPRELEILMGELTKALASSKIASLNIFLWHSISYAHEEFQDVSKKNSKRIINWTLDNFKSGGTNISSVYQDIIDKKKTKRFTICFTDGEVGSHKDEEMIKLWTKALDPRNLIYGITIRSKVDYSGDYYRKMIDDFPGTLIPIFLDHPKFGE